MPSESDGEYSDFNSSCAVALRIRRACDVFLGGWLFLRDHNWAEHEERGAAEESVPAGGFGAILVGVGAETCGGQDPQSADDDAAKSCRTAEDGARRDESGRGTGGTR